MCRLSERLCVRAVESALESLSANVGLREAGSWDGPLLLSGTSAQICHMMGLASGRGRVRWWWGEGGWKSRG